VYPGRSLRSEDRGVRLGVLIVPEKRWPENSRRFAMVEELGFDSAWTYDHIWWRGLRDEPWFSSIPLVAAAASITTRVKVGIMVTSPNFRHPVLVAKDAIAIEDISGGRFVLGIGAGAAQAGDAEVLGGEPLSAPDRFARFQEFVELTDRLLREPNTTFDGRFFSARDARMLPGCIRKPRLPLAIAACGPRSLAVAARYGDAWVTPGPADWLGDYTLDECVETVAAQFDELRRACERNGRDVEDLERILIATGMCGNPLESPGRCLEIAERFAAVGMTHLVVHWPRERGVYANDPHALEEIAASALPQIRALSPGTVPEPALRS
jgi:alkanesulfonate monooxygenase SsuD/methylene tetrahydromethanopterin reductase-like flavin-dependent oxidoreductase (luciferase family)